MTNAIYRDLGQGISCIDANYGQPGIACFYLLQHHGVCAIIETGTARSVDNLQHCLAQKSISASQIRYIIPTHVHLDHAGGAGAMMALFPAATLLVHPKGAKHLIDPQRLVASSIEVYGQKAFTALYGEVVPVAAHRVQTVEDEFELDLNGRKLHFRHTPGHADHHFCVWDELSNGWFSGDMFGVSYQSMRFARGDFVMASTTPTQFRPEAFLDSVELLKSYSPSRMYVTHFGELTYSDELATLLCKQVQAYPEIARECAGDSRRLEQRIMDFTLECLAPLDPPGGLQVFRSMIQPDAQLNAQGMAVWFSRMQKNTAVG